MAHGWGCADDWLVVRLLEQLELNDFSIVYVMLFSMLVADYRENLIFVFRFIGRVLS